MREGCRRGREREKKVEGDGKRGAHCSKSMRTERWMERPADKKNRVGDEKQRLELPSSSPLSRLLNTEVGGEEQPGEVLEAPGWPWVCSKGGVERKDGRRSGRTRPERRGPAFQVATTPPLQRAEGHQCKMEAAGVSRPHDGALQSSARGGYQRTSRRTALRRPGAYAGPVPRRTFLKRRALSQGSRERSGESNATRRRRPTGKQTRRIAPKNGAD